jgi:hypothetical protein
MLQQIPTLDYRSGSRRVREPRWTHAFWLLASSATLVVPLIALVCWISHLKIGGR